MSLSISRAATRSLPLPLPLPLPVGSLSSISPRITSSGSSKSTSLSSSSPTSTSNHPVRINPASAARCFFQPRFQTRRLATHTRLPDSPSPTDTNQSNDKPQTMIEKIVQRYAVDLNPHQKVQAGDYVSIKPNVVMTHDNTGPCIDKFQSIGGTKIKDPRQVVFALDHDVQNKSSKNLSKYSKIESFARSQGVDFYPAGRGIGHQVMVEEGYAFPLTLTVASDSHSNMYGGIGSLGTPIVRTDAAAIWASGQTWWQIPEIVKVELKGSLKEGVTGKDIIVALCGYFNQDQVLNSAIEFVGDGIGKLSIDERLAISNMTTEWGALAGVFPIDQVTLNWYEKQISKLDKLNFQIGSSPSISENHPRLNSERLSTLKRELKDFKPDPDARYSKHLVLYLDTLSPHVSGPNSVKISTPLSTLREKEIAVQKAYLVSCVNSRTSDLSAAASVVKGKKISPGVEFYIAAASSVVQKESEEAGDWGILMAAGAKPLPAGCGPCIGLGVGLLKDGEVGISATNRNYKGRMGSPNAQAYLASPAVVAASAVAGKICGPEDLDYQGFQKKELEFSISVNSPMTSAPPPPPPPPPASSSSSSTSASPKKGNDLLLPGFPESFSGPIIFAPQDNLNTDGIYPGKYTYQDDITPTRQSQVVMENYDGQFSKTVERLRGEYDLPFYNDSKELIYDPTTSSRAEGAGAAKKPDQASAQESEDGNQERRGVILISGYNFGTGSSREQAATALKYSGIPLVITGSFGDIFKRNSINNGLICLECPELVEDLTRELAKDGRRNQGGKRENEISVLVDDGQAQVRIDSTDGKLILKRGDGGEKSYVTRPPGIGKSVQDIFTAGGLEAWVKKRLD